MKTPFKLTRDGVVVSLGFDALEFLGGLPELLEDVAAAGPGDPGFARLNVAAYRHDDAAQREYSEMATPMLAELRAGHQALFVAGLEAAADHRPLTLEQAEAWLTVLGDARLAIAARLGITEAGWSQDPPQDGARAALDFLSFLQDRLVAVLAKAL